MAQRETLAEDLEMYVFAVYDAVCVEKLGNHFLEFLKKHFHIVRFHGKSGNIVAGNPLNLSPNSENRIFSVSKRMC